MLPTVVCLTLAWLIWREVQTADVPHRLTADFALLCLVLCFRAGKDLVSAWLPKEEPSLKFLERIKRPGFWTLLCLLGVVVGIIWTKYSLPLPPQMVTAIETEPPKENNRSETPASTRQPERRSRDGKESGEPSRPQSLLSWKLLGMRMIHDTIFADILN